MNGFPHEVNIKVIVCMNYIYIYIYIYKCGKDLSRRPTLNRLLSSINKHSSITFAKQIFEKQGLQVCKRNVRNTLRVNCGATNCGEAPSQTAVQPRVRTAALSHIWQDGKAERSATTPGHACSIMFGYHPAKPHKQMFC